ncbi:carbohydrate kinase family protein [Consotaella aegiceratis]|uniref:carbohydrate kinase family protein n=1 Tax=Consotaella aegiceratis TaxID=3097961 RepID=UPI002F3E3771
MVGNNIADEVLFVDGLTVDGKVFCEDWRRFAGGQAANVAATLSHLGLPTVFVGRFGGDEAGKFTRDALRDAGVVVPDIAIAAGRTMSAIVAVDRLRHQRTILMRRDPALMREPLPIGAIDLEEIGILYGDGFERQAFLVLARQMRDLGRPVVSDLEQRSPDDARLLALVTHLVAPAEILRDLAGEPETVSAILRLTKAGPSIVVATQGGDGAVGTDGDTVVTVPAETCDVTDTTGAGDAFHAGFMAGLHQGLDLKETLRLANRVAAVKCTQPGPKATAPSLAPFRWSAA